MRIAEVFAFMLIAGLAVPGRAEAQERKAVCPPPGDTLSLLQPRDSGYRDAPAVIAFLRQHGMAVRCVTRSTSSGIARIYSVAGFQTDRGTITVLFVPPDRHLHLTETKTARGSRYTFVSAGERPYVVNTGGQTRYLLYHQWLIELFDPELAVAVRRMIEKP